MNNIIFTGIYKPKFNERISGLDDQLYYTLMPVRALGKVYMIDTYHMDSPIFFSDRCENQYDAIILRATEGHTKDKQYIPYISDYYYKHYYEITEDNVNEKFDLLLDLKDYKPINSKELYKYKEEDYREGIKLWWECKYPRGYCLIKKEAKENITVKLNNLVDKYIYDLRSPKSMYPSDLSELIDLSMLCDDYYKNRYNYLIEMNNLMEELKSKYNERQEKLYEKYLKKIESEEK